MRSRTAAHIRRYADFWDQSLQLFYASPGVPAAEQPDARGQTRLWLIANAIASARPVIPSFVYRLERCVCTVRGLTKRAVAISALESPRGRRRSTSTSRRVSPAG